MAVTARGLVVRRERFTLDVAEFVAAPTGTAIVGPNGAGKTTLLLALQGLLRFEGAIECSKRSAGVFARPSFMRGSTLWNVEVILKAHGFTGIESTQRALKVLEKVGLADALRSDARRLSSGQQQRLALARALALEPEVLFLDEPFANVDADARVSLRSLLRSYAFESQCPLIVATQTFADVVALSERVVLLEGGRNAETWDLTAIRSSQHPYLQALITEGDQ
jgi:tungstate transport system ATP-binding protein